MQARTIVEFRNVVWAFYDAHGRHELPWRKPQADGSLDPYEIMVSEIMLQQTQVNRVIPKYEAFLTRFPSVRALAQAELGDVLRQWQGLGYNRRAKFLRQAAQAVIQNGGTIPRKHEALVKLPGIGDNTAGAIIAYAYNRPVVFLETNVRTVFIHHFFSDHTGVPDSKIKELVLLTLPEDSKLTRDWYWALMDYGSYLKKTVGNLNKLSNSYTKQSKFHGSRRQLRGAVLRILGENPYDFEGLVQHFPDERLAEVLEELESEQLIRRSDNRYSL